MSEPILSVDNVHSRTIAAVTASILDLELDADVALGTDVLWDVIEGLRNLGAAVRQTLVAWETACGESMGPTDNPENRTAVMSDTVIHRSRPVTKVFDDEALLEAVMDARMFDPKTGELVEETPLHKILHVYGSRRRGEKDGDPRLPGSLAKKGELTKRGIDPDAFCSMEFGSGWKVQVAR